MPLYNEIEILVKKQNDLIQTKDFFTYAKYSFYMIKIKFTFRKIHLANTEMCKGMPKLYWI